VGLSAIVHTFEIALNDADRGVYEQLEFRLARHPSETAEYLLTRVLAYALEFAPGLAFSAGGLSDPDYPALEIRDLTGRLQSWIEVGLPEPARLHKAAKAAPRVAVYAHRDPGNLLSRLAPSPPTGSPISSSTPSIVSCWPHSPHGWIGACVSTSQ